MKMKPLGNSSLEIPPIGIGCNRLVRIDDKDAVAAVDTALDLGVGHFDTAENYGATAGETFLGQALQGRREDAFIATKFGMIYLPEGGWQPDGTPEYLRDACDGSLKRLRTDYIDLYYQHRVDPHVPLEETFGALGELVSAGKVRALGISNPSPDELRRAHATFPISAVQMEYSIFTREVEAEILPLCGELGITFVAYGPLAYSLLSDQVRSVDDFPETDAYRRNMPRFQSENIDHNVRLLETIRGVAAELDATPSQAALAWLVNSPYDVVPIPGSRRPVYVRENAAAAELPMSPEQWSRIDAAYPAGVARGHSRPMPPVPRRRDDKT